MIRLRHFYGTKVSYVNLLYSFESRPMKTMDCSTLGVLVANREALDLIDIRTENEFSAMHIPGAHSVPFARLASSRILPRRRRSDEPVYIISDDRGKASLATGILRASGYVNAVEVEGGMQEWLALGLPVLSEENHLAVSSLLKIIAGLLAVVAGIAFAETKDLLGTLIFFGSVALFVKAVLLNRSIRLQVDNPGALPGRDGICGPAIPDAT